MDSRHVTIILALFADVFVWLQYEDEMAARQASAKRAAKEKAQRLADQMNA